MVSLVVKDTGHVVVNTMSLKKIVLTYSASPGAPTPTVSHTYTIIEKLGNFTSIYSFADLFPQFCDVSGAIGENPSTSFKCYQDNNFSLYEISPSACNNVLGLDDMNLLNRGFEIYPNPNSGNFTIQIPYPSIVIINNCIGQKVFEEQFNELGDYHVNFSNMPQGLYFVTVTNENGKTNVRLVKE